MRFLVEIEGTAYSRHKEAFKRLLAKHGLRWKGTRDRPLWAGAAERVTAEFERDEGRDILLRAVLRWGGRLKSKLLADLKAWAWGGGGGGAGGPGRQGGRKPPADGSGSGRSVDANSGAGSATRRRRRTSLRGCRSSRSRT